MGDLGAGDQSSLPGAVSAGQGVVANGLQLDHGAHCPACATATALEQHRDTTAAAGWSVRRGALSFAIVIARRNCPAYAPIRPEGQGDR